jgi:hypothetical protein
MPWRRRASQQMQLSLERPAQPNERLRLAFKDAELDRAGLDLAKVLAHQRARRFLDLAAAAQRRGHLTAARSLARQILSLKKELT